MSEPKWLSRADVEALHAIAIERDGGSHGLRDGGLLESALARPQHLHAYGEANTFQLAASYAEGIARNHAFIDGNKRTALASSMMFLRDNGYDLLPRKDHGYVTMMESLAQGRTSREDVARYMRENARERSAEKQTEREQVQPAPPAKDWNKEAAKAIEIKPLPPRDPTRNRDR